ncbi:MAG: SUMF1/EgtB/PvdO family nonheme iron enzyme, partial [Cyanobacteria bacterium P01_F01_bin.153]
MAAQSPSALSLTLNRHRKTNQCFHEDLGDGVKLTMMQIPGGTFTMGAPQSEEASRDSERPQREVEVSGFFMGRYSVTQEQWRIVAGYDREEQDLTRDPSH